MSVLTLGSTNPNFSHVVTKNPATILASGKPFERKIRKGKVQGWFSKLDNSEFRLLFRDSEVEASFSDEGNFEYLDKTRYSSPYAPIQIIAEALRTASIGEEHDVEGFRAYVHTVIQVPPRIMNRVKFGGENTLEFLEIAPSQYWVKISSPKVLQVLNLLQVLCILSTLTLDQLYVPMGKDVIFKYLRCLTSSGAEYNLRQLFVSRAITNPGMFEEAKTLGLLDTDIIKFSFGNTQNQRLYAIKEFLLKDRTDLPMCLIDIGCGELSHSFKLSGNYPSILAYDADPEICRVNELKITKRKVENIQVFNTLVDQAFVEANPGVFDEADVLISEVLEHMDIQDAVRLLNAVLNTGASRVVVTVPCGEFNKFYGMDVDEKRHPEHVWEPTRSDWNSFINMAMKNPTPSNRKPPELVDVGDVVEGIPCTFMAVFKK